MSPPLFILHLLSASIAIHGVLTASSTCNETDWNQCSENLVTFMKKPEFPNWLTEGEITEVCKGILPQTLKCEEAFGQRCFNGRIEVSFRNASAEAQMVLKEACTPGEPENTTNCTRNEWQQCEEVLLKLDNIDLQLVTSSTELASICIVYRKSFECQQKFAGACFSEALKAELRNVMDKLENRLLEKCNPGQATYCEKKQQECGSDGVYFKTHSLFMAVTKNELLTACNSSMEYITCMTNYAEKCRDPDAQQQVEKVFAPMSRLIKTVCNPNDPFQRRFLNYTACFSKFATEYEKCGSAFMRETDMVLKSQVPRTLKEHKQCCYFEHFLHCTSAAIQSKCGKGVADTGEKISKQIFGKEIESACSAYQDGMPQCSFLYSSSSTPGAAASEPPTGQAIKCALSYNCVQDLKYLKEHGIRSARTENELTTACRFTKDAKACVTGYAENCTDPSERQEAIQVVTEMQIIMDTVCKPGDPFRLRYLNFTACYPNFSNQLKACEDYFLKNWKIFTDSRMSNDIKIRAHCCSYESFRGCARTAMERKCGRAVADTGLVVIEKLMTNEVESTCARLRHDNPECPSSSSSASSATSSETKVPTATTTAASKTNAVRGTPLPLHSVAASRGSFSYLCCFVFVSIAVLYN